MEFLFWLLLGGAIGAHAAQKRGFATIGGVLGGMLLGPFAFLLYFVSGIVSSDERQRKCPHCAEWIRTEATVCKHCHRDVGQPTSPNRRERGGIVVDEGFTGAEQSGRAASGRND